MMQKIKKKCLKAIFSLMPTNSIRMLLLRLAGYYVGRDAYVPPDLKISDLGNRRLNLFIGDRVSIGPRVTLITDSSPNHSLLRKKYPLHSGIIRIENDAWIGAGVIILPDVTIGQFSIVAAGSIVKKNVAPYTIVGGIPSKLIGHINENEL